MLAEIYPRAHARFTSLRVLGPHLDGFVVWLCSQGYPRLPIRLRIRETSRLDARLRRRGVRQLSVLSRAQFLDFVPRVLQRRGDEHLAALVRSLARYFDEHGLLACPAPPRASRWSPPTGLTSSECAGWPTRHQRSTAPRRPSCSCSSVSTAIAPCCGASARSRLRRSCGPWVDAWVERSSSMWWPACDPFYASSPVEGRSPVGSTL